MLSKRDIARAFESGKITYHMGGAIEWCHLSGALAEHWRAGFRSTQEKKEIVVKARQVMQTTRAGALRRIYQTTNARVVVMSTMIDQSLRTKEINAAAKQCGVSSDKVRDILRRCVNAGDVEVMAKPGFKPTCTRGRTYTLTEKGRAYLDALLEVDRNG